VPKRKILLGLNFNLKVTTVIDLNTWDIVILKVDNIISMTQQLS
jgi:hypothetical protein